MKEYYNTQEETSSFTGRRWLKRIIEFILELHLEEWYFRCASIESTLVNFGDQTISLEKRSLIITIQYFYSKIKNLPAEQRKWFENPVAEYVPLSVKTLKQWISQTKTIFKDNKNRKIENRKITEFFSTDKSISKTLIPESNSNDIKSDSNSKVQNSKEYRKGELNNREKKQKLQNAVKNTDKDSNENNGNIIMNISTDSTANNDDNIGDGYRDEEVNSKTKKIEKTARIIEIIDVVQIMKNKKKTRIRSKEIKEIITYRIQIPQRIWRVLKWRANTEREKKQIEKITTYTLNLNTVTNIIYIKKKRGQL